MLLFPTATVRHGNGHARSADDANGYGTTDSTSRATPTNYQPVQLNTTLIL